MSGAKRGRRSVSYRSAIIALLWNSEADGEGCGGNCEDDGEAFPICRAMRALGFGEHFTSKSFRDGIKRENG